MLNLIVLGLIAGVIPVYMGIGAAMLLGKVLPRSWEGGLIGLATGVLVYLFFDLMHEAVELSGTKDVLSWVVFLGSLGASLVGLVALESSQVFGGRSASRLLSLPFMIAIGMGFHNLGEGLAIGASYANEEWALSLLLVTGFALHNGTEGFGIVGAAGKAPVQWRHVFLFWLVAGGPTCVGTLLSGQGLSPMYPSRFIRWRRALFSMSSAPSRRSPTRLPGMCKWPWGSLAVSVSCISPRCC